jgi:hypothetical protein
LQPIPQTNLEDHDMTLSTAARAGAIDPGAIEQRPPSACAGDEHAAGGARLRIVGQPLARAARMLAGKRATKLGAMAAALLMTACASAPPINPAAALVESSAGEMLALSLSAKGVQTYECRTGEGAASPLNWVFVGLRADLSDENGRRVRYTNANTGLQTGDAGRIRAQVRMHSDIPSSHNTPWLYLSPEGLTGRHGRVAAVARIHSADGVASGAPCTRAELGKTAQVDYSADYRFFSTR